MDKENYKWSTCGRCGRRLTDKKSMERGLGPVCYQKYLKDQSEIGFDENQMTMDEVI